MVKAKIFFELDNTVEILFSLENFKKYFYICANKFNKNFKLKNSISGKFFISKEKKNDGNNTLKILKQNKK